MALPSAIPGLSNSVWEGTCSTEQQLRQPSNMNTTANTFTTASLPNQIVSTPIHPPPYCHSVNASPTRGIELWPFSLSPPYSSDPLPVDGATQSVTTADSPSQQQLTNASYAGQLLQHRQYDYQSQRSHHRRVQSHMNELRRPSLMLFRPFAIAAPPTLIQESSPTHERTDNCFSMSTNDSASTSYATQSISPESPLSSIAVIPSNSQSASMSSMPRSVTPVQEPSPPRPVYESSPLANPIIITPPSSDLSSAHSMTYSPYVIGPEYALPMEHSHDYDDIAELLQRANLPLVSLNVDRSDLPPAYASADPLAPPPHIVATHSWHQDSVSYIAEQLNTSDMIDVLTHLGVNTTVRKLYLAGNNVALTDEVMPVLARSMRTNTTLTYLNLASCSISLRGAAILGIVLRSNTTLETLLVQDNAFLECGSAAFAKTLSGPNRNAQNSTLKCLNLSGNAIMDNGLSSLSNSLIKSLVGLQELHLTSNAFTDASAIHLSHLAASHPSLKILNLQGNRFSSTTVLAIDNVMRDSIVLVNLTYNHPPISLKSNGVINRSRIWWKPKHEVRQVLMNQQSLNSGQEQLLPLIRTLTWS
ncbi:expressed protein [Batrachochytrium dendrobatidis JAM81]|uniref:Expressed protein n=1 Tax=Batrachochytrium dendrobatidis (strain JAM81 / FGSC 10211) TaxID=684364 RepID=F4P256_BATDJ|nr:uncharacterized protein BATDEDRAFT_88123 [Batrachochytrium dendrobatidis JAM81]EGF81058.1 expressed protein [Batrachochytrium dendrobatidis JAM81]|eukprot:XP_006678802.1 expressed protein [Batrachochytrium dendrobatidis JAM81]